MNKIEARKLSFNEVWESTTVFYVNEKLEDTFDKEAEEIYKQFIRIEKEDKGNYDKRKVSSLLIENPNALDLILSEISISKEKFTRIITLLRRIGIIPGEFDVEWTLKRIKNEITRDKSTAIIIGELLVDGAGNRKLNEYIPKYYLERLSFKGFNLHNRINLKRKIKDDLIGKYASMKGRAIEDMVRNVLCTLKDEYDIGFAKGRSYFIDTDIDWAVPSLEDPYIIIMASYQETTSSSQSMKARDMISAYERICRINTTHSQSRVFINFVDGGGWIARKKDFKRLVNNCHYFLNIRYLNMLEDIILKHVPSQRS